MSDFRRITEEETCPECGTTIHHHGDEECCACEDCPEGVDFGGKADLARVSGGSPEEAEHTPGPWRLCHHLRSLEADAACGCGYRGGILGNDGEHMICEIGSTVVPGEEGLELPRYPRPVELANARLIAAAPTMKADLDRLKTINAELLAACQKFLAVRANYGGGFDEPFDHDEDYGDAMIAIEEAIAKATQEIN